MRFDSDACTGDPGYHGSFDGDIFLCRFARRGSSLTGGILAGGYLLGWKTAYGCPFLSGSAGAGLFRVDNAESAVYRFKPAAAADVGVRFFVSENIVLTPAVRMLYVYDRDTSLTGVSILIMAGTAW